MFCGQEEEIMPWGFNPHSLITREIKEEKMISKRCIVGLLVVLVFPMLLSAESRELDARSSALPEGGEQARSVPNILNFQGYLADSEGQPVTDSLLMVFRVFTDSTWGTELWTESRFVKVEDGVFNVLLGRYVSGLDSAFLFDHNRFVEVTVDGEVLEPRTRVASVPYAFRSHQADTSSFGYYALTASYASTSGYADAAGLCETSTYSDTADFAYEALHSDTADYALSGAGGGDTDWDLVGTVLYTHDQWGVARGDAWNKLWGTGVNTHTNLGTSCTTGVSGQNRTHATVSGGERNVAGNSYSAVCGGKGNVASGGYGMVGAGLNNTASEFGAFVGSGQDNEASGYESAIAGGRQNEASGDYAAVCGGSTNMAAEDYSRVGGGWLNHAEAVYSGVGGGFKNVALGNFSTVGGGREDTVRSHLGGVLSGYGNVVGDDVLDSASVICGGRDNAVTDEYCFIGGGKGNEANYEFTTICGGMGNKTESPGNGATIGGGAHNYASGAYSMVGGGEFDSATAGHSVVSGGWLNRSHGGCASVTGGYENIASGWTSAVLGGTGNVVSGSWSAAIGGSGCVADGDFSYVFGLYAEANGVEKTAVFDWGVGEGTVFIGTDASNATYRLYVNGNAYATGVWNSSDRDFKTDVRPLESSLALVSRLNPVRYTWKEGMKEYGIDEAREDVGFIAQDLQDVLPEVVREMDDEGHLAVNYNHITAVNTAAIQELLELVETQHERIEQLEGRIADLEGK
jgi:hypothetical protein